MPPHFPALGSEEPLKPAGLCAGVSAVQSRSQCGHKRQLISDRGGSASGVCINCISLLEL